MSLIRTVLFKWLNPLTGTVNAETKVEEGDPPSPSDSSFQMAGTTKEAIYKKLVAVAQGDTHQVLPAMDAISRGHDVDETLLFDRIKEVGRTRPYEAGHFMMRLSARASTAMRLQILGEIVRSPLMGDKHAVGELFETLMERSTRDERRGEIYPALEQIIKDTENAAQPVQGNRAFLAALLKGWKSEI